MLRRLPVGFVALIAFIAIAAPTATADEPLQKGFEGAFELHGTNGYKVLGLVASTGRAGVLILSVGRKGAGATYYAHGEVTREHVEFALGALGKVELSVRPTGRQETVQPKCGKPLTVEAQEYLGTIEFHGEEGFTEATASSTPLRFKPLADIICPGFSVAETSGGLGPGVRIKAAEKGGPSGPSLILERNHEGARVFYEARIKEKQGAISVSRTVTGHLASGSLDVDKPLSTAAFAPGAPFSGKAHYTGVRPPDFVKARPGKGIWRGSLEVDFPGRSHVRLSGPGFKASIIHATRSEERF